MADSAVWLGPAGRHLAYRLTTIVKEARLAMGWSQVELARRAGSSQSTISRLERGGLDDVDLGVVGRVLDAFGARVELGIEIPHLADRGRQRDAGHARCVGFLRHRLEAMGWTVRQEVEIVMGRSHGWIDLFGMHQPSRTACVLEVKTELVDAGELERQIAWYEREAWSVARRLRWQPLYIGSAVVALDTKRVATRLRENAALLDRAFPTSAQALLDWLASPGDEPRPKGRALAMVDPLSRRRAWLQRSVLDGRRRVARYADYADFMRRLEAPRHR